MVGQEVNSARRKRMATQQALHGQRRAAPRAVTFNGFDGVMRAGRIKATGAAEKRTEDELIRARRKQQQLRADVAGSCSGGSASNYFSAFASRSSSSRSRAANGAVATELRG